MIGAMPALLRRLVLWLLVAAVPWHVGIVAAMAHGGNAAVTTVAAAAIQPPCHEAGMSMDHGQHDAAGAAASGRSDAKPHCAACPACCAFAAPPSAVALAGPPPLAGELRTRADLAAASFLTGGPLRPPRPLAA